MLMLATLLLPLVDSSRAECRLPEARGSRLPLEDVNVSGVALGELGGQDFCYLTTTGRRTGRPHRIEIWFGARDGTLYLLAGGGRRSDWVRNLEASPEVTVEIGPRVWQAVARIVTERAEDRAARELLASKYQGWREGSRLSGWARTALPIAVELRA
jgi:deazaflavin-dependent oxidoreductase (nitroreductase family)